MNTFIAILRGINVSGKNKIKMAELRDVLDKVGLKAIQTYIQSGNIIFQSADTDKGALAGIISSTIKKEWGYDVPTLVLTRDEFVFAKEHNPFWLNDANVDITKLYVTFMDQLPDEGLINSLSLPTNCNDFFEIINKQIFVHCPGGYGKTKLNNNFFERKVKQTCTTRNWKTISKLIELSAV